MRSLYKKLFLGFFCCLCLIAVSGQSISTIPANGLLPDTFLNRYFAGEGVKLHNCKFNWSSSAINGSQVGTFANTNPQFPFSSGVILTTGNISVALILLTVVAVALVLITPLLTKSCNNWFQIRSTMHLFWNLTFTVAEMSIPILFLSTIYLVPRNILNMSAPHIMMFFVSFYMVLILLALLELT